MEEDTTRADPQAVGQRIEELLSRCAAHADPTVAQSAEEMARLLMGMYGAGLERIVALLAGAGGSGYRLLHQLLDDDLVTGLLVLHDLHPENTEARVGRALESVRPYLGSHAGDVEFIGLLDEPDGTVVRLALKGSCDGCPSSAVTVTMAIEKAIEEICPEVVRVDVEDTAGMVDTARGTPTRELPVLQIGRRPAGFGEEPEPEVPVAWVVLEPPPLRPGQCAQLDVAGTPVLLLRPAGAHNSEQLLAYRDGCPSCRRPLDDAALIGEVLTCANCAVAFDVRHAGRAVSDPGGRHLEPLPLVQRAGGWRLAVPRPTVGALA